MYKIMHKDKVVALADDEQITAILSPELCPGGFTEGKPLDLWLESRTIDVHRSHSRQLFKALRMNTGYSLEQIVSIGHAISITDNWWIQKEGENLDYNSLKKFNEALAEISLHGVSPSPDIETKGYLQLGTTGSFEKAWKFHDGSWIMYKQGTEAELISEFYAYQVLKGMDIPVAEYGVHEHKTSLNISTRFITSHDFTNNAEFDLDPFCNYFGEEENSEILIPKLLQINADAAKSYALMIYYDALLCNADRHNQNVGFLRDVQTGHIVRLAPAFDYNISLASACPDLRFDTDRGSGMASFFVDSPKAMELIKDNVPCRSNLVKAVHHATAVSKAYFQGLNIQYAAFEDYVLSAYDFIAKQMIENKLLLLSAKYVKHFDDTKQKP